MHCNNCDYVNPDNVAFCVNCGARLTPPVAARPTAPRRARWLPVALGLLALLVAGAAGLV